MSSGKVKCTCGWSWNKSDSSKKDMYICHECGRDNSNNMKNGGWLDSYADGGTMQEHQENYNNSEVSLPKGFVGMGNNIKGRNYSPAWGGQFQMGGNIYPVNYVPQAQMGVSIPGAVGFSYARVGAPSKGPHRNKVDVTDASAQNGVKFDPKKFEKFMKDQKANTSWQNKSSIKEAQDEERRRMYDTKEYQDWVKAKKKAIVKDRKTRIKNSVDAQDKPFTKDNWRQQLADETQATGDKFRLFPDDPDSFIDDYINPGVFIGNMASKLGSAPLRAEQENSYMPYVTSIAEPVVMGAVGEIVEPYINKAGKVVKKTLGTEEGLLSNTWKINPFANKTNLPEVGEIIKHPFRDQFVPIENISDKVDYFHLTAAPDNIPQVAARDSEFWNKLNNDSRFFIKRTDNTPSAIIDMPIMDFEGKFPIPMNDINKYRSAENIKGNPHWLQGYKPIEVPTSSKNNIGGAFANLSKATPEQLANAKGFLQRRQFIKNLQEEGLIGESFNNADLNYAARFNEKTDALTKLALERKHTGFRNVSGNLPFGGKGEQEYTGRLFDMNVPAWRQEVSEFENMRNAGVDFNDPKSIAEYQAAHIPLEDYGYRSTGEGSSPDYGFLFRSNHPVSTQQYGKYQFKSQPNLDFTSGNRNDWFKKYYQDLDYHLQPTSEKSYFRPRNSNIDDMSKTVMWKPSKEPSVGNATLVGPRGSKAFEIDKEFPFENLSELNSKQLKDLEKYRETFKNQYNTGWRGEYKDGGVIKDDMGYWNPDNWDSPVEIGSNEITMKDVPFDVLGISDEGDIKHMKPGKNYKYKGKKVTEFRMAQNGLRQEQKGLQNLDQLTNFTNYNKPQPGGWLNKYN